MGVIISGEVWFVFVKAHICALTSRRWCVKFMETSKGLFCWRWPGSGSGSSCMKSRLCLPGGLRYAISFSSGRIIFQHNFFFPCITLDARQSGVTRVMWYPLIRLSYTTRSRSHRLDASINATEWDRTRRRGSETRRTAFNLTRRL